MPKSDPSDRPRDLLGLVLTPTQRPALCNQCGAVRAVSRRVGLYDRRLKCTACKATTKHALVGDDPEKDWREHFSHRPPDEGGSGLTEEEEIDRLRNVLELGLYDATSFETPTEQQERIAKTRLHGDARTRQFIELHRQGLDLAEIERTSDWSREVVRQVLRKAGVTEFNNHLGTPGLTWEPPA
jgi:hypothetical protein